MLLAGAAPASATVLEHTNFTQPYAFANWSCGYPMDVVGQESHTVVVRDDKRTDDIVYVTDVFAYDETWTNADGNSFRVSANGVAKDVRAKRLGATEYQFKFQYTGQPIVVRDSSGALIARKRGNVSFNWTYDFADRGVQRSGHQGRRPAPALRHRPVQGRRADHRERLGEYQTARPIGSTDSAMGYQEYLPPSYTAAGAKSPLLIALNGYGETGDGTPEAIDRLLFAGIPRFIDVGGWPTDRPFVVLSPAARRGRAGLRLRPVRRRRVGRLVQHAAPARPRQRPAGVLHDARRGPRLHRLRGRPLQRRPRPGVPHRVVVRRLRHL